MSVCYSVDAPRVACERGDVSSQPGNLFAWDDNPAQSAAAPEGASRCVPTVAARFSREEVRSLLLIVAVVTNAEQVHPDLAVHDHEDHVDNLPP